MGLGVKSLALKVAREVAWRARSSGEAFRLAVGTNRIGAAFHYPTDMCEPDRLMIYALVRGLRPKGAIEIGVRWGGGARIISAAMEDNGEGRCVGLDPVTNAFRASRSQLHGRYSLVRGRSPEDTLRAVAALGVPVDFVFIDALHIHASALADLKGIHPHLTEGAHILMHDTFHLGIDAAARDFTKEHPNIYDLGFITRHPNGDDKIMGQGLRLLRVGPVNSAEILADAYGRRMPADPSALWNYDAFALRTGLVHEANGRYEVIKR